MSATFNGQTVGFMLKERLGWERAIEGTGDAT